MSIVAWFITAKKLEMIKMSMDRMDKQIVICSHQEIKYSNKEKEPYWYTEQHGWILTDIMLREKSQTQKSHSVTPIIWIKNRQNSSNQWSLNQDGCYFWGHRDWWRYWSALILYWLIWVVIAKFLLFDDSLNLGFILFSACLWVVILNGFLIKNKSYQHVVPFETLLVYLKRQ